MWYFYIIFFIDNIYLIWGTYNLRTANCYEIILALPMYVCTILAKTRCDQLVLMEIMGD